MSDDDDRTMPLSSYESQSMSDDDRTMPLSSADEKIIKGVDLRFPPASDNNKLSKVDTPQDGWKGKPVTGWLVCVDGAEKGRDYRIYPNNNVIGSDPCMDICIRGDDSIASKNHAMISYGLNTNEFYLNLTEPQMTLRHNGEKINNTVMLRPYDSITLGKTELIFVPLCRTGFQWMARPKK